MTNPEVESEVVREMGAVQGQVIMPFYLVVDVSASMRDEERALNDAIAELVRSIEKDPVVDDMVMISLITFNNSAQTLVPLCSPSEITLPSVGTGGGTSFGAAFREYASAFERDRVTLKARGVRIYRPCVFFLTDGMPGDLGSYLNDFRSLFAYDPETGVGNRSFPYFVPFGFRDASRAVVSSLAYPDFGHMRGRWFLSTSDQVGEILQTIAEVLGRTVVSSGLSASSGKPTIVVPEVPAGSSIQFGDAGDYVD